MLAHVGILNRDYAVLVFNHSDFCSNRIVEVCKFSPNGTRAHNDQALWLRFQSHGFTVAYDVLPVLRKRRQVTTSRSGRNDDVVSGNGLLGAVCCSDFNLLASKQSTVTHDHVDFVLFHQELHAFRHAVGHSAAAIDHPREVCFWSIHLDAIVFSMVDVFKNIGAFEQGFGGNASPV